MSLVTFCGIDVFPGFDPVDFQCNGDIYPGLIRRVPKKTEVAVAGNYEIGFNSLQRVFIPAAGVCLPAPRQ
jgi:hypothetical protein